MDKRNVGTALIILTVLLCACPGSCLSLFVGMDGFTHTAASGQPFFTLPELLVMALVAAAFVAVPILVAFAFFAPLPGRQPDGLREDEPLPPAI